VLRLDFDCPSLADREGGAKRGITVKGSEASFSTSWQRGVLRYLVEDQWVLNEEVKILHHL
jgi:hypothetical protein